MLKRLAKSVLWRAGVHVVRTRHLPRGIDWMHDINCISAPGWSPRNIFDVGANVGQTAIPLAKRWKQAEVHAFEPVASTFKTLQSNVARMPRIHPHKLALGARQGRATMAALPNNVLNSLKSGVVSELPGAKEEIVEVSTVDSFAQQQGVDAIDVLKTDTEGFDLEVLQGASSMLERNCITYILCEVTFVPGCAQQTPFDAVHGLLSKLGFLVVGFYDTRWLVPAPFSFCNALFALRAALPEVAGL